MPDPAPSSPRPRTPTELQRIIALERRSVAFLVYRDSAGQQIELPLEAVSRLSIGRDPAMDMALTWDTNVSRLHAELERRGETWLLVDEGMSTNGTRVNGDLVSSRRRLSHGETRSPSASPRSSSTPPAKQKTPGPHAFRTVSRSM